MCLAASCSFIVCVTPTIVLTVGKAYWTKQANPYYDIAKADQQCLLLRQLQHEHFPVLSDREELPDYFARNVLEEEGLPGAGVDHVRVEKDEEQR